VIKSLYFTEIHRRWDKIEGAAENTNAWLFHSSEVSFSSWLGSDSRSMYCITGLVSCLTLHILMHQHTP
jgi:hypothetical protein